MSRRTGLLLAGALVSILVTALLIGFSDLRDLRARAIGIDPALAMAAGLAAILSYACIAGTQHALLALLGARIPAWAYLRLSMISVVIARTVRSGGTSGLAFLAIMLARRGVPPSATLAMGLGNVLVNASVVTGFIVLGLLLLVARPLQAGRIALIGYALGAGVLVLGLVTAWTLLTRDGWRRAALRRAESLAARLGRRFGRDDWGPRLHALADQGTAAARELVGHPRRAWRAWGWAIARLATSLASLALCAEACGVRLPLAAVLLAFIAMKLAGSVAFVPAGLGVVDGSLAGMLTLLGAPYEAGLLVAALHRVAYHVIPALLAIVLAGPMLGEILRVRPGGRDPD